jgi:hypothetical protein
LSPNKIDSIAFKSVVFKMLGENTAIGRKPASSIDPEDMFNPKRIL